MNNYKIKYRIILVLVAHLFLSLVSCTKLVEVDSPINRTTQLSVYNNDANAISVLTAIYTKMIEGDVSSSQITGISTYLGLSGDELTLFDQGEPRFFYYTNSLNANNVGLDFWSRIYPIIFSANSALEGLSGSNSLTPSIKQQLLAEAKFVRAFCYFYLINLYGDVPLATSTDWKINTVLSRSPKTKVLDQVISDLKDAQSLFSQNYLDKSLLANTTERVRPTKWAATALLARAYLFHNDWINAETQASAVINHSSLYDTVPLINTFLKNNKEAIWQLQPVITGRNTEDAWVYKLPSTGPDGVHPVYLSANMVNAFESGDKRREAWVDSVIAGGLTYYYPSKYRSAKLGDPVTEYSTVLRLAEQYLIRAEARVQQNKIAEGRADLNVIRTRARLGLTSASDKASLLSAIIKERRVELFTEWGHRWLDLKRTGTIDAVMGIVTPQKGGTWAPYKHLFPISESELRLNPNLIQNTGY